MELLINTWHCEDSACEKTFFTILEDIPSFCPHCGENYLADSKVLEAKELVVKK